MARGSPLRNLLVNLTHRIANFWRFIALMGIFAVVASWLLIDNAVNDEKEAVFATLNGRAASLAWAIEGGARIFNYRTPEQLSDLLGEMALQPGIASVSLVEASGRILADSAGALRGVQLYTPGELKSLQADSHIQGRISPDEPNLYETWKLFQPGRLGGKKNHLKDACIFIDMDISGLAPYLSDYAWHLGFLAALVWFGALCATALAFYIHNFGVSSRKLARIQALAALVMENFPGAIIITDLAGYITLCNQGAHRLLDLPASSPLPKLTQLPCYDWASLLEALKLSSAPIDREGELCASEKGIPVSITAAAIHAESGAVTGYLFIIRDLAEIRLLQARVAQSERLAGIANLAAGMAHEIRNPLSSIRGYAHFLAKRVPEDALADSTAELLIEETERINGVLSDVLALTRAPALNSSAQPLKPLLAKALRIVEADAQAKNIDLRLDEFVDTKPWPLFDSDKLLQACLNLLLNAIQATPSGGKIQISVSGPESDANWRIAIQDNGCGMNEQLRQQVFTPYFTTKASGSGLGLPITRQIIESHGGELRVRSVPGYGSVFTIILPATQHVQ